MPSLSWLPTQTLVISLLLLLSPNKQGLLHRALYYIYYIIIYKYINTHTNTRTHTHMHILVCWYLFVIDEALRLGQSWSCIEFSKWWSLLFILDYFILIYKRNYNFGLFFYFCWAMILRRSLHVILGTGAVSLPCQHPHPSHPPTRCSGHCQHSTTWHSSFPFFLHCLVLTRTRSTTTTTIVLPHHHVEARHCNVTRDFLLPFSYVFLLL